MTLAHKLALAVAALFVFAVLALWAASLGSDDPSVPGPAPQYVGTN